ncbi:MAG TPA: hypothetical protein VH497_09390, partial [Vicinamibacterales bacterium]
TERKSTIKVKDGESVKVTGCVAPVNGGHGFMLTNVADKTGALRDYILVSDDVDLSKHIGHCVQIEGTATDRKDGKVQTETQTRTKVEGGDDKETKHKSEINGPSPYLGVRSLKMIAAACQ